MLLSIVRGLKTRPDLDEKTFKIIIQANILPIIMLAVYWFFVFSVCLYYVKV